MMSYIPQQSASTMTINLAYIKGLNTNPTKHLNWMFVLSKQFIHLDEKPSSISDSLSVVINRPMSPIYLPLEFISGSYSITLPSLNKGQLLVRVQLR